MSVELPSLVEPGKPMKGQSVEKGAGRKAQGFKYLLKVLKKQGKGAPPLLPLSTTFNISRVPASICLALLSALALPRLPCTPLVHRTKGLNSLLQA